jgi:hypothetical protein
MTGGPRPPTPLESSERGHQKAKTTSAQGKLRNPFVNPNVHDGMVGEAIRIPDA